VKTLLKYLAAATVIGFWAIYIYRNWQGFSSVSWKLDYACLFAGFFLYVGFYLVMASGWAFTLRTMGFEVSIVSAMRVWEVALPARYLPGGFWHIAGRTYMGSAAGVTLQGLLVSTLLEHILSVVGALGVFLVGMAIGGSIPGAGNLYLLILIPLGIVAVHPRVLRPLLRMAARILRRNGPVEVGLSFGQVLLLLAWFAFSHVLSGASLFLVLLAISPVPLRLLPLMVGANAFAWAVGLLAVVAPAGIGVREASIVLLGSSFVSVPIITAAAFATRFLSALAEVFGVALFTLLSHQQAAYRKTNIG